MFSSLTHAKMMIRVLESNRKNSLNRRPIFARRQCRNSVPIVLPCRYSSRLGSPGTASKINFDNDENNRGAFPSDEALLKLFYLALNNIAN